MLKASEVLYLTSVLVLLASVQPENSIGRARDLLERGQFVDARAILEEVPRRDQTAESRFLLGQLDYLGGDYGKASVLFEKAAGEKPQSLYFLWLGRAFGRRAEEAFALKAPFLARKAREAFQRAVELDPENLDARDDLLEYYLNAPGFLGGGKEKARSLVEEIKSSHPGKYHLQQAEILLKDKNFAQAEQEIQKALEIEPGRLGNYTALAELYEKQGQVRRALEVLEKAEQRLPDQPAAHFELGRLEAESGQDLERVQRELASFLKQYSSGEPYPFEAHYWLGQAFLRLNQPRRAIEEFQAALKLFPAHVLSLKGLAEARRRLGKPDR